MPNVEVRPLTPADDMDAQLDLAQRAFGVYTPAQRESWDHLTGLRISQGMFLGAFVAGQPVGAGILHDMRQWWHGRAVRCVGVGGVKVAPEQRGKGVGRRLLTAVLVLMAVRGYPLSALYPATMPLYRSLGWELAGGMYQATIPARSLRSLLPPDAASAATSGGQMLMGTPVPSSKPASVVTFGSRWTCQWNTPSLRYGAAWNLSLIHI